MEDSGIILSKDETTTARFSLRNEPLHIPGKSLPGLCHYLGRKISRNQYFLIHRKKKRKKKNCKRKTKHVWGEAVLSVVPELQQATCRWPDSLTRSSVSAWLGARWVPHSTHSAGLGTSRLKAVQTVMSDEELHPWESCSSVWAEATRPARQVCLGARQ